MLLYVLLSGTVACLHRDPVSAPAEPAVSQPIASPEPAGVPWVGRYEFQDVECLYFISINADHTYTDGFLGGPILGGESDPGRWSEAGEMLLLTPAAGGRLVDGDRYLAASRNGRLFLLSSRTWAYACSQLATFDPGVNSLSWGAPSREYVGPPVVPPTAGLCGPNPTQ